MKILFINTCNGFEAKDPIVDLVEFKIDNITTPEAFCNTLKKLENSQIGVGSRGGHLNDLLTDIRKLGILYDIQVSGRKSFIDQRIDDYWEYNLISGNH